MNIKSIISEVITVRTAMLAVCVCLLLIGRLPAQSADVFQSLQGATQVTSSGTLTNSPPDIELLKSKPSRFAMGHIDLYVAARMADLSIKGRDTDPFGLYQDTNKKAEIKTGPTFLKKLPTNFATVPFSDIVKLIKVSTIMVKEKSFLVKEGRVFKESEEFEITYNEKKKRLKVIKVEPEQIFFKDLDSGEEAILKTEILPFGMSSGDSSFRPPGMVSPNENEPLKLGN